MTSIIAFKTCGKFNRVATHTITFSVTNGIERFFTSDEFMLEIVIISRSLKELLMIILARRMNLFSKYEFVTLFSIICKDYFDDSHDIIATFIYKISAFVKTNFPIKIAKKMQKIRAAFLAFFGDLVTLLDLRSNLEKCISKQ